MCLFLFAKWSNPRDDRRLICRKACFVAHLDNVVTILRHGN